MKRILTAVFGVALLLSSCSGMKVKTDFDPDADFSMYRTYSWLPAPEAGPGRELMKDPLVRNDIHSAVDKEMVKAGFTKTDRMSAALLVTYYIGTKKRVDVDHYGYGYGPWGSGRYRGMRVHKYKEGTLIIDFIDSGTMQVVWRGWASSSLKRGSDLTDYINHYVPKIMERYPPEK